MANWSSSKSASQPWLVALGGFAVMYLPVYWSAGKTLWQTDENAHVMVAVTTSARPNQENVCA